MSIRFNDRRKLKVLVVGTGLAGGGFAGALAEMGYKVEAFKIKKRDGYCSPLNNAMNDCGRRKNKQ